MVASSMFTRRAAAGSAEARRAGAKTECRSRFGGPEQKLVSRARAHRFGDSKMRHCNFIAPALSRITKRCPRCATVNPHIIYHAFFFDQKCMRLTRSTKDRKKGCAYDPGALKKQGVLKKQILQCTITPRYVTTTLA